MLLGTHGAAKKGQWMAWRRGAAVMSQSAPGGPAIESYPGDSKGESKGQSKPEKKEPGSKCLMART